MKNEPITIEAHAYDIEIEENESPDGDIRSEMRMWCFNRKSEPCLLRVRDFPVFCKMELPRLKDSDGDPITWDNQRCAEIVNDINKRLEYKELPPVRDWEYKKMKKLYYYAPPKRKFPFLVIVFNTVNHMYATSKACKKLYTRRYGPLSLPFYEMKIPIYNKMFSLQKLSMSDKFTCKGKEIHPDAPDRISKEGPPDSLYQGTKTIRGGRPFKEYEISWTTMKPSKDVWFSYPVICSFDIESYSHNHRTFPQKHDDEDVVFSISVTISKYMDIDNRKDYIIIIGDTLPAEKVDCPSAKEGKLIILNVSSEAEVFQRFYEIVEYEDPDVFIGYNIYGFDLDYMDARILDSGEEWPNLSRLSDDCGGKFEIKNLNWSSSGRGANKMFLPTGSGRISFDMYKYIQMDFKLPIYSLEAVSQEFLKEGKDDLKYHEMFKIHGRVQEAMKSGEPFSQEILEENTSVVKYNVQDSLLVTRLFEKLSVWVSVIELSSIVRVLPMHFCTRGQLMRCMAQIYHVASWKDIVLSTTEIERSFFAGGYVANPIVGYWPLVMCFDFNSLYPSIIIAYNLCYTTWIKDIDKHIEKYGEDTIHIFDFEQDEPLGWKPPKNDKFDYSGYTHTAGDDDDDDEDEAVEVDEDGKKKRKKKKEVKKIKKHYRLAFCKKEFQKGFIPEIEESLLGNRKKVKKELKREKGIVKNLNKNLFTALRDNPELTLGDITDSDTLNFLKQIGICEVETKINTKGKEIQKRFDAENMMLVGFYDARQKGLKICANSLYGFFGAPTNEIYFVQMSNIITYMGRSLIIEAGHFFEEHYRAVVVYGDSILPNEPILVKNSDGKIMIKTIGELYSNGETSSYEGFKVRESNRKEKEQSTCDLSVWSKGKWHKIKRLIRHKTNKKIYRINTHCGLVDVTEDHSLLDENWEKMKPKDCEIGQKLAQSYPDFGARKEKYTLSKILDLDEEITNSEALIMGFFFGDGTCGCYQYERGVKNSWNLCNSNKTLLKYLKKHLRKAYGHITDFKILDTLESSGVYKLVPYGNIKYLAEKYCKHYNSLKEKIVPDEILNGDYETRKNFWKGYYLADGAKKNNIRLSNKGKQGTAQLFYLVKSLGYNCSVSCRKDKLNIYRLTCSLNCMRKPTNMIKKIEVLHKEYTDYVYDIETENGHFQAGIGEINVKNTDSTMVQIPEIKEELVKVKKYIVNTDLFTPHVQELFKRIENGDDINEPEMVWILAEVMDRHINGKLHIYDEDGNIIMRGPLSIFLEPLNLEAEKMMRAIYMRKKHYVYFEYDKKGYIICIDGTNEPQLECKGILLARRDNCMWSRFIYRDIVMSVFDDATPAEIFEKIINVILEVVDVNYETIVEKFSVVKGMGSNYKSKTASMFVFGEEMKALKRPIQPGERIKYVVVKDHQGRKGVARSMRTVDLFHECWDASGMEYGDVVPEDFEPEEGMYPPEELDSVYYIEKVLMNPIDRLFNCVFNRIIEPYTKVGYRPHVNRRLGKGYANTPVKMIVQSIKDHKKFIEKQGFKCMTEPIKRFLPWFKKIKPGVSYGSLGQEDMELG